MVAEYSASLRELASGSVRTAFYPPKLAAKEGYPVLQTDA